ncbi:O-antigen/teichoic acid export membrane protein [Filimonas zeae]|uniref:hypothetical protein n=1 Tax=Filimonas zeae TaxID=1737353 RepID=UPI00166778FC|nr:hypothetical protein [Filimonas zeae]MDR6341820.1 O-antigen/teichoic acid export membrane protein [Filimonas zeae]
MKLFSVVGVLKNRYIQFIFSRYFIYVIQFANSILIAKYLGPYYLGIWGFLSLVIQYLTQFNFGIPHALNVKLATSAASDEALQDKVLSNSIFLILLHSVFILFILSLLSWIDIPILKKYHFNQYGYMVLGVAILQNLNQLFICVYRVKNLLRPIIFYQALMPVLSLLVCFLGTTKMLLYALLISQLVSYVLSLIVFMYKAPVNIKWTVNLPLSWDILKKGMALLLYNGSFYFIMIVTRTAVSIYFGVKELGYFSFALNLAQATFLALDTISFLIFPKLINKFKDKEGNELIANVEFVRKHYSFVAYLLIFLSLLCFPVILVLTPEYANSYKSFVLLSISMALLSGSFGISTLFVAFGRELLLGKIALAALLLNTLIVWGICSFSANFYMIALAPIATYFVYCILLSFYYSKLYLNTSGSRSILSALDWKLLFPVAVLLAGVFSEFLLIQLAAYILIILLNLSKFGSISRIMKNVMNNPGSLKI